jgi:pimeloyl-ACP methyl ester carboxylesterase
MPSVTLNGVELAYESVGDGFPIIFAHEFASDARGWEPQVRAFTRLYCCITYNFRGFPPSSVPSDPATYSEDLLIEDLYGLVRHLGFDQAYFIGFSMGGSVVINFAIRHPELARAIVAVGTGSGSTHPEQFRRDIERTVALLRTQGIAAFADTYSQGPTRQPFKRKDPHGWDVFRRQLAEHSAEGQALTMLGVQGGRATIFEREAELRQLRVPTLIVVGDEDEPCLEPSLFMKRQIATSGLLVVPQTGHAVNLEEPSLFNQAVLSFLQLVEAGRWATRASISPSLLPAATDSTSGP